MPRTVTATRYVTPLREGGSLPAIMEADDDGLYVVKFHGAGQGPKALTAELIAAAIGRLLDLPVPETVLVDLDPALGMAEPDPEIQELLERSAGLNVGIDYLPGSLPLGAPVGSGVSEELAADVVWFDAFLTNVDRTPRNPNLLLWHRRLWLIDHGAALYFHHAGLDDPAAALNPFPLVRDHVLLPRAGRIAEVDVQLAARLTPAVLQGIVERVPTAWLAAEGAAEGASDAARARAAYLDHLLRRLAAPRPFVTEAVRAHDAHL
jgi:hypothetical protein